MVLVPGDDALLGNLAQFDGEGQLWALGRACIGERTVLRLAVAQPGPSSKACTSIPLFLGPDIGALHLAHAPASVALH